MSTIKFRYNKYSDKFFVFLSFLVLITGLFLWATIIYFSGITKGPEYALEYFKKHTNHAIYLMFGSIPFCLGLPLWFTFLWWKRKDEEALLQLYENYAILYYRNNKIRINKGELVINTKYNRIQTQLSTTLKISGKKINFTSSYLEKKEKRKAKEELSLDVAIEKLMYYEKGNKEEKNYSTTFYEFKIVLGITTPEIFEDSAYYVDYDDVVIVSEAPFVNCYIREKANPIHVVGDMLIDIRGLKDNNFNKVNLTKQTILEIIEVDEKIEIGPSSSKIQKNNEIKKKWPLNSLILGIIFLMIVLVYIVIQLYIGFASLSIGKIFYFKLLFVNLIPASLALLMIFGRNDWKSMFTNIIAVVFSIPFIYFARDLPILFSDFKYLNAPKETILKDTIIRSKYVKKIGFGGNSRKFKCIFDGIDKNNKQQLFYFRFSQPFWKEVIDYKKTKSSKRIKKDVIELWEFSHGTCKNPIKIQYLPNSRLIMSVKEIKK